MTRIAGGIVDVADFPRARYVRKLTTDSVTNDAVADNDTHIVMDLDADRVYQVELYATATAGTTGPDVRITWAVTGGAAALTFRTCIGPGTATTDVTATGTARIARHALTTNVPYGCDGTSSTAIYEAFLVETTTAGTPGSIQMKWAQNTATVGVSTSLTSATYMVVTEVDPA